LGVKAHNVIIVTSGRVHCLQAGELDRLIRSILRLKKNPILILGPDGDELLRISSEVESCEIIFDPNFTGDFFSSVKAGLSVTQMAAFVIVIGESRLDPNQWLQLEQVLREEGREHALRFRPITRSGWALYPVLLTESGVRAMRNLPASTEWNDDGLILTASIDINISRTENNHEKDAGSGDVSR
jgi:hypothetical protein